MAEQTSEQLDEKLRQEGYTPSPHNPNRYETLDDRGNVVPVWTSGDTYQERDSSISKRKD